MKRAYRTFGEFIGEMKPIIDDAFEIVETDVNIPLLGLNASQSFQLLSSPGHTEDHISIYDPQTRTLFNGDAIGMHWWPQFYVCNSNSIYWNEKNYLESIEKVRALDLENLCIAHFGVFTGEDIDKFIDNSMSMYYKWMENFDQYKNKLEDIDFIVDKLWEKYYQDFHNIPILKE